MLKVKIFSTDRKVLSQGIHICNMKALSLFGSKVVAKIKFTLDRQTDGQTEEPTDRQVDSYIPLQTSFAGGIITLKEF